MSTVAGEPKTFYLCRVEMRTLTQMFFFFFKEKHTQCKNAEKLRPSFH